MFISHLHYLAIVNSLYTKILYLICLKFTTSTSCQTHSVHARSFLLTSTLAWVLCNVQRTKQLPLVNAKRAIPRCKTLSKCLQSHNMLLHTGYFGLDDFTFDTSAGQSVVDYIFSDNILPLCTALSYKVNSDFILNSLSDHALISFSW